MAGDQGTGLPEHVFPEWKAINSSVGELHLFWKFHSRFCGKAEEVELMQRILPFPYAIIRKGLLFSIIMEIRRLMDPAQYRGDINLSLERLVEVIKDHVPTALHEQLAKMREEIHAHCLPIIKWGNKRVGHAGKDMALGLATEKLPEVDEQHFESALAMMHDLLKQIHAHFNGPDTPMPFPEPTGDAEVLLDYIRTGHYAKQAGLRRCLID